MRIVGSAVHVAVTLSAIVHCMYFYSLSIRDTLISSCHHSCYQRILIYSQRARAYRIYMADAIDSVRVRERAVCICK